MPACAHTHTHTHTHICILVWHPPHLIKEWGCVDLSMDTLHLKYPLVLFGSEGPALTIPLFLLLPRIITLCHCSSTMAKDHFLLLSYGTKRPLCVDVHLNTYSFIHSYIYTYIHTYMHAYIYSGLHACIHTYIHTHSYIHTDIYTSIKISDHRYGQAVYCIVAVSVPA